MTLLFLDRVGSYPETKNMIKTHSIHPSSQSDSQPLARG